MAGCFCSLPGMQRCGGGGYGRPRRGKSGKLAFGTGVLPPSRSGGHQGDFQFGAVLAESALNARDRNSRLGHIGILAVTRLGTLGSRFHK